MEVLTFVGRFTALRFMATGAPPFTRRMPHIVCELSLLTSESYRPTGILPLGRICMRLVAGGAAVAVKRRAVNLSTKLRSFLYIWLSLRSMSCTPSFLKSDDLVQQLKWGEGNTHTNTEHSDHISELPFPRREGGEYVHNM
jgi:hypothetical protein